MKYAVFVYGNRYRARGCSHSSSHMQDQSFDTIKCKCLCHYAHDCQGMHILRTLVDWFSDGAV